MKMVLKCWLLLAIVVSGLAGLVYITVQQVLRSDANYPQIQMAEDIAAQLAHGAQAQDVVPAQKVDIATSLATYIIVFDNAGNPLASSAQLNGQTPTVPAGVFDYVRQAGEDRITWQPQSGVRSAIVVTRFQGTASGFVLVGRSLREVEKNEDALLSVDLLGWACILIVSFLAALLLFWRPSRSHLETVESPNSGNFE